VTWECEVAVCSEELDNIGVKGNSYKIEMEESLQTDHPACSYLLEFAEYCHIGLKSKGRFSRATDVKRDGSAPLDRTHDILPIGHYDAQSQLGED
jgi:hypothetical protein